MRLLRWAHVSLVLPVRDHGWLCTQQLASRVTPLQPVHASSHLDEGDPTHLIAGEGPLGVRTLLQVNRPDGDDIRHRLGRNQRELGHRDAIVVQLDEPRSLDAIVRPGDLAVVGHGGIVANSGRAPPGCDADQQESDAARFIDSGVLSVVRYDAARPRRVPVMTLRTRAAMSSHRCKNAQHGSKTGTLPQGGFSLVRGATG